MSTSISTNVLDWIAVSGYILFAIFIGWQVLTRSR